MLTETEQKLLQAIVGRAEQEGIEIVTVEVVGARKAPTIRVYIDTDHGVTFDDILAAQVWINDIVERIDPFPGAYTVEVSSPGIDRPLRTLEQFEKFTGETAYIKAFAPIEGRSAWTGILRGVDGDTILIEVDGTMHAIPYTSIKRANVKGTVDFSRK